MRWQINISYLSHFITCWEELANAASWRVTSPGYVRRYIDETEAHSFLFLHHNDKMKWSRFFWHIKTFNSHFPDFLYYLNRSHRGSELRRRYT